MTRHVHFQGRRVVSEGSLDGRREQSLTRAGEKGGAHELQDRLQDEPASRGVDSYELSGSERQQDKACSDSTSLCGWANLCTI